MPTVVIEPTNADVDGVADLLALAVGMSDPERLGHVCAGYLAGQAELAAAFAEGSLAGVVGYRSHTDGRTTSRRVELLHIATDHHWQRKGVGAAMIQWVRTRYPGDLIEARTDREAVGFYRSIGFDIESLGEVYPGVERFRAVLPSRSPAG